MVYLRMDKQLWSPQFVVGLPQSQLERKAIARINILLDDADRRLCTQPLSSHYAQLLDLISFLMHSDFFYQLFRLHHPIFFGFIHRILYL